MSSDCGEQTAATTAGSGQCFSTTVTSELVSALTAVQSVTPAAAAAAESLPGGQDDGDAAPSNSKHVELVVSGDVASASPLPGRFKPQTTRKRCRPTADVSPRT